MTSAELRACAAIVQCSRAAGAPALADALWQLADALWQLADALWQLADTQDQEDDTDG